MRAVYDTNVFISGILWEGTPKQLIKKAIARELDLVVSPFILAEVSQVLRRFGKDESYVASVEKGILDISTLVHPRQTLDIVRDKKDNRVLECALEAECDYLVTGDSDLLTLKEFRGVKTVTPAEFCML